MIPFENILRRAGVRPGQSVGDFGCGREGRLLMLLAEAVGAEGKIYALDIVKSTLSGLERKASTRGFHNIIMVWTDLEKYGAARSVPDHSLDAGFLINVLWQSKNHEAIFRECSRMIKPGGRFVVVEWANNQETFGPPQNLRISREKTESLGKIAKLQKQESYDLGKSHHGVTFVK